jgi:transketolase
MLAGYCSDGGRLAGHPERGVPGVEMTGGSLGHGPAIAVGIALAERRLGTRRTYCLVGDGELDEGSVWEAIALAGQLGLDGLTVIVDANGLQGLGPCDEVLARHPLGPKLEAFGFAVDHVDGHDHRALAAAFALTADGRPKAVVARTIKGYGVSSMEGDVMSHYRTLRDQDRERVLAELERR